MSHLRLWALSLAAAGMVLAGLTAGCVDATPTATVYAPLPAADPAPGAAAPAVSPLPGATAAVLPTPRAGNSPWAKDRVDAVVALYRPTAAGTALLRSLDLRQMQGEPGFFGSYGFDAWAGVGEAKPIGVMHELMHSYWGGFPVIGRPDLDWTRGDDGQPAPALAAYHRDVLAFMAQPPDDYEFLRQRLRNLPEVSAENPYPLFHSLEADLPYLTGGDLGLVPPILRKYWGLFLSPGPFHTWERAAGWFQGLSAEDRAVAGKYLGFEHLDLRQYPGLTRAAADGELADAAETLAGEERQRLTDFAAQFDLLVGDAQLEENFQFWRGYIRDKVALHRRHPGHLESSDLPRAGDLAAALEFMSGLEGGASERADSLAGGIAERPLLVNFLPAAGNRTLLEMFGGDPELPDAPTLRATASFVERLRSFAAVVDRVLAEGQESPQRGARALEGFVAATGLEAEQDLRLFFGLFRDAGGDEARQITAALDQATVRALMPPVPVHLRGLLRPRELLDLLDITTTAADTDLQRGIGLLIGEPSGNYRIDEPFLERLYAVMAERAEADPPAAAQVMADAGFPLEGMLAHQPSAAALALGNDIALAADLAAGGDAVTAPPARIIYRLIAADPTLAARVVATWAERGQDEPVAEALAYFAYDKIRAEKYPQLPISLAQNGAFLATLLEMHGAEWLEAQLAATVSLYQARVAAGESPADFLAHYRDTLDAAVDAAGASVGGRLRGVVRGAFDSSEAGGLLDGGVSVIMGLPGDPGEYDGLGALRCESGLWALPKF